MRTRALGFFSLFVFAVLFVLGCPPHASAPSSSPAASSSARHVLGIQRVVAVVPTTTGVVTTDANQLLSTTAPTGLTIDCAANTCTNLPPPFDPSTLPLTYWRRAPFVSGIASGTGAYWLGQWTPAGFSFKEAFRSGATVAGASLNGIPSVKYLSSGATRAATVAVEAIGGGTAHVSDFLTASQFTFMGVVNFIAPSAHAAQPYDDPKIWAADSGQMGFMYSDLGLGYFTYDGSIFPRVDRAITTGWHFFCIRYGGPVGSGNVEIDIDSSAGTPTAIGNMGFALTSYPMATGYNTFSGTNADIEFDAEELVASKVSITNAQRDAFKGYANARYAQAF